MSRFETEEEQIDAIKTWWKKNGTALLTAVLVVVIAISGWRYWQNTTFVENANASATFEILQSKSVQGQFGDVAREALKLMNELPESPYATAAALLHAKFSMEKGEVEEAKTHLQWAIDHAPSAELKAVSQLRMTRLLIDAKDLDAAQTVLSQIAVGKQSNAMLADVDYIKALIALSQNKIDEARAAFQAVLDNEHTDDNLRGLTEIQLADLAK